MSKKLIIVSAALTLLLSACMVSLASDVTPPPNYRSPTPPQAQVAQVSGVQPLLPPDPAAGASIYADKCLPCHGAAGLGDGPQATKLGLPVAAIGTVALARNARPVDWYTLVTNGQMEKGMPPFRSLNDRQRWDVVAYAFSLSEPQSSIDQGKALYSDRCAACHGVTGRGDGPDAAKAGAKMPDWSDPGRLSQRSASDLVKVIKAGVAPGMPAFADKFSDDQLWALVDAIRSLSFASSGASQASAGALTPTAQGGTPAATPDATQLAAGTPVSTTPATSSGTATPFKIAIGGKVTNSGGNALPAGLKVTIQGYDSTMSPFWSATTDVQADGSYRFDNVDVQSGRTYLATVEYQNVPFQSDPLHSADLKAGQDANLPISISDVTSDAKGLSAQRLHLFFDFSTPGAVQVAELFVINNPGDKAIVPAGPDKPVLSFELPQGAQDISFQDGTLGDGRYVKTDKGFGDLTPVLPKNQSQVLFGYQMAYTGQQSIAIPLTLPVESTVVMVPSGGVSLQSSQLTAAGTRNVSGTDIQLFTSGALAAGSTLNLTLSGQASNTTTGTASTTTNSNDLVIGIGVFGVVLIVAGIWLYRQRRNNAIESDEEEPPAAEDDLENTPEAVLDAIVALDDLHQAGQLPEPAYQQRRAELKARLKAMRNSN